MRCLAAVQQGSSAQCAVLQTGDNACVVCTAAYSAKTVKAKRKSGKRKQAAPCLTVTMNLVSVRPELPVPKRLYHQTGIITNRASGSLPERSIFSRKRQSYKPCLINKESGCSSIIVITRENPSRVTSSTSGVFARRCQAPVRQSEGMAGGVPHQFQKNSPN